MDHFTISHVILATISHVLVICASANPNLNHIGVKIKLKLVYHQMILRKFEFQESSEIGQQQP